SEIGPTAIRAYDRMVPSSHHDFTLLRCGLAPPRVASRTGLLLGKRAEKLPFRPVALPEQTGHVRSPTGYARGAAERSPPWVETPNAPSWNVLSAISLTPASATTPSPSTRAAVATCATTQS